MRVESWTRAVTDLFLGKIEVVEYSRDRTIKGVRREYPMPVVGAGAAPVSVATAS
jgi:hypothetical protein